MNQLVLALVVMTVIGVYGSYLVHLEQRAIRERLEPILSREIDRLNHDVLSLEGNAQKLKSLVDLFDVIPREQRTQRFRDFAAATIAPHSTQFNSFFALGPRLAQKYFGRNSFVQVVHRDYSLFANARYNDPSTFVSEEFLNAGYDEDPDMQWWSMNISRPGVNFSEFYFDKGYMEKVMFTTGVGIYGADGHLDAVVGIDTLAGDIAHRLSSNRLGDTGGLLVVDEHGRPVLPLVAKDLDLVGYKNMRAFTRDEFNSLPKISQKMFSIQGMRIQDFYGVDGKTYVTISKAVKGRPWHMVVFQEKTEAYANLYFRLFFFILLAFIVYLLVTVMIWFTGNYVMTHDRKAMMDLRESRDRAEAATRAKSLFLSTMSHEIRTPLNAMLGSTELIAETELTREQHSYLKSLQEAGDVLLSVLNNVLDFSKIESGRMQLESREFRLSNMVNELESLVRVSLHRKNLQWSLHVPNEDRWIVGDSFRVKQILMNLLSNATKFTDHGMIELTVQPLNSPDAGKERIYFEVKDSGVGIARENLKNIFEEFNQEDSSVTRKFGGTGLGLSICRKIAQLMGSELMCESQQNVGSKFFFVLDLKSRKVGPWPQKAYDPFEESRPQSDTSLTVSERSVLIVDDVEENHALLRAYLKKVDGVSVESAYSGMECLEKCEAKSYSLIMMDVQMPKMSGLEAIRKLRAWEAANQFRRVPIVVISANSFTEDVEKSLLAGADEHCGKPIRKHTVIELVRKYCFKTLVHQNEPV